MTATAEDTHAELSALYDRYKALALAASAALILDRPVDLLATEAERLVADCARGTALDGDRIEACFAAAASLRDLLVDDAPPTCAVDNLESVRASHRALRASVWEVLPCEYVPCCAGERRHDHRR